MWSKISSSKAFYMILAIVCAIISWLYVDIVEAPDAKDTIYNIPVTFVGEDILAQEGLMITEGKDTTVDLVISGPRAAITKVERSNIKITVQAASQITGEGDYSLSYSESLPSSVSGLGVRVVDRSVSEIDVTVVQMITRTFEIEGRFTGSLADEGVDGVQYLFDQSEFQFEVPTVTVSGERSLIEQIAKAEVTLDAQNLSSTWTGELPVVLEDSEGNPVDMNNLTVDVESVYTIFPIQRVKEVPLEVSFVSGAAATEDNVTKVIDPLTVKISGTEERLAKIESINVGTIDLSKIITSDVLTFTIPVPDGVNIISGNTTATVSVSVTGLTTRMVDTSNIQVINVPEGISVALITQSLSVRIRGDESVMSLVMDSDILITVDLAGIDTSVAGNRTMNATVSVVGFSDVGAVGEYQVTVNIGKS